MDNRINGVKIISANENISEGSKSIILEYVLEGMAEYYSADLRLIRESYSWINIKCKFNGDPITFGFNFEPAAILGTFVFRGFFYARILLFTAVFEQSVCVLCKISFIFFKVYSVGTPMPMSFVPIKITRFFGFMFKALHSSLSNNLSLVSPLIPRFLTCLFLNSSAHSAPFVILFPRKIMSLEVTGSSSNNVARW